MRTFQKDEMVLITTGCYSDVSNQCYALVKFLKQVEEKDIVQLVKENAYANGLYKYINVLKLLRIMEEIGMVEWVKGVTEWWLDGEDLDAGPSD